MPSASAYFLCRLRILNNPALWRRHVASQERFVSIQALRAIAASVVVLAHLEVYFPNALSKSHPLWQYLQYGGAGVDLFFVISGFVMVYASERFFAVPGGPKQFFLRRLARIIPLYWICTSVWILLLMVKYKGSVIPNLPYDSMLASYFFIPLARPNGVISPALGLGWSLNFEMMFYAIFACVLLFQRFYAVIAASIILMILIGISSQLPDTILTFYDNPRIYQFIFGMIVGLVYRRGIRLSLFGSIALCLAGMVLLAMSDTLLQHYPALLRPYSWGVAFALIVAAGVLCKASARDHLGTKTALLLGDASYALYLVHTIALAVFSKGMPGLAAMIDGALILLTIPLLMCTALAVLVHLYVEKPIAQKLKRSKHRQV